MINPADLEHKGSLELSNLMNQYENKIQEAAAVEHGFDIQISLNRREILKLRMEANELEQSYKRARKVRLELESSHRVIKTIFYNNRNAGQ